MKRSQLAVLGRQVGYNQGMVALTSTTDFTAWTSVDNPRAHACAGWSNLATASEYQAIEQSISSSVAATNELNGKSNHERQEVDRVDQRNQQYSIYALTDSSGAVSERYAYTAYGQPTFLNASATVQTSSAAGNRYTYTAREWDATLGLHYFRARWMSGLTGRFLTRDPIGYLDGWSLYRSYFVTFRMDPSGLGIILSDTNVGPTNSLDPPPMIPIGDPPIWVPATPWPIRWPTEEPVLTPLPIHIGPIRHSGRNRCIFSMGGSVAGPVNFPPGPVFPIGSDPSVIPDIIRKNKCCEVIFMGHQGGTNRNSGGVVSYPGDGSKIQVLPNDDLEKRMKEAFKDINCRNCQIYNYACASVDEDTVNKNRNRIAKNTGCDVYGLNAEPFQASGPGESHTADCRRWPSNGLFNGCKAPDLWKWPTR